MTEQHLAAINYERRGTGEPLLLIHGIGHRWQAWEPVLDTLAEQHDVIAIDLPGFGKSPRPVGGMPHSVPALAAVLGSFLAELGVDRPHVAGNSLGGGLALELGAAGIARSATALSPAGFATRAEAMRALAILVELRGTTFLPEAAIRRIVASPAGRRISVGMVVAKPDGLSRERTLGDALSMRRGKGFIAMARALHGYAFDGAPDVPVTIAWGDHDRILIPRQATRAEQRLPLATHVGLAGCGHVPMSDDPELIAATILATTNAAVSPA
jgi:pimeloyl-ACP methyl ester carboxylesterase